MKDFIYFPIVKTRDAELKAMSYLDKTTFDFILPIYELTKSRKSKITPDGDIHKKMIELKRIQGDRPFILDLCANENYINPQIETLLSPENGYYEWVYFLNTYNYMNIIPMVHIYDDDDFQEVENFVTSPYLKEKSLAVRIPFDVEDIDKFIMPITDNLMGTYLYVIIDLGQMLLPLDELENKVIDRINEINKIEYKKIITIVSGTSFPKTVGQFGEHEGSFEILEEKLYLSLSSKFSIKYGDYASINIEQIEMKGGTFIPRIDISLNDTFIYKRYRRTEGSYPLCAKKMIADTRYTSLATWADSEIKSAAEGIPSGISPSFWIAVRMNYFMTKRVNLRQGK